MSYPNEAPTIVYDNDIGTQVLHPAGTVRRDEWRLAWEVQARPGADWLPVHHPVPTRAAGIITLERIQDPLTPPAAMAIRSLRLERRTIWESPWKEVED